MKLAPCPPKKCKTTTEGRRDVAAYVLILCLVILCLTSCQGESHQNTSDSTHRQHIDPPPEIQQAMKSATPFFRPMGKPETSDWLASHKEPGQTFEEYINEDPTLPTNDRKTIYVLPLGKFNAAQEKILKIVAEGLGAFYGLSVQLMNPEKLKEPFGVGYFRKVPGGRVRQVRTGYLLDDVIAPRLPADAAAMIALTAEDLYPDESMNFVFGQASFDKRVGVWSLFRLEQNADLKTFLMRALKIAAHEIGHMFSIRHCTKYECVMNGSNYLGETDRHPLDACPECMAKIAWLSGVTPADRYRRIAEFCKHNDLSTEAGEFDAKLKKVEK